MEMILRGRVIVGVLAAEPGSEGAKLDEVAVLGILPRSFAGGNEVGG